MVAKAERPVHHASSSWSATETRKFWIDKGYFPQIYGVTSIGFSNRAHNLSTRKHNRATTPELHAQAKRHARWAIPFFEITVHTKKTVNKSNKIQSTELVVLNCVQIAWSMLPPLLVAIGFELLSFECGISKLQYATSVKLVHVSSILNEESLACLWSLCF